jgi:hypothetical protein
MPFYLKIKTVLIESKFLTEGAFFREFESPRSWGSAALVSITDYNARYSEVENQIQETQL